MQSSSEYIFHDLVILNRVNARTESINSYKNLER